MLHPDEGVIQMLLDGELDPRERARVEGHIAGCAACAARLAEAQHLLEEADRLVDVLTVPPRSTAPGRARHRFAGMRTLAWAASIVLAVGVGYWGRGPELPPAAPLAKQEPIAPATGDAPASATPQPEQPAAATPVAPEPLARADAGVRESAGEVKSADARRANEVAPMRVAAAPPPAPAEAAMERRVADESTPAWRVISMEDGVRLLGGQIRLIDGMAPDRVETGPGTAVAGADPAAALVRVVYATGGIVLDQQRAPAPAVGRQELAAKAAGGMAAKDMAQTAASAAMPGWQERGGVRFVVTGSVSAESLRALSEQVR